NALKEQGKIEVFVLAVEIEPIADLGNGNPLKSTVVIGYETVPVHIPEANVPWCGTILQGMAGNFLRILEYPIGFKGIEFPNGAAHFGPGSGPGYGQVILTDAEHLIFKGPQIG